MLSGIPLYAPVGIDLIYEGITTLGFVLGQKPRILARVGIDLIYEGITTRPFPGETAGLEHRRVGIDLIYEGITTWLYTEAAVFICLCSFW